MNFEQFIRPELLVLVPVLFIVGAFIKKALGGIDNRYIPLMLGFIGIALAVIWVLATMPTKTKEEILLAVFTGVVQGILCAGASVYGHQIIAQAKTGVIGPAETEMKEEN